MFTFIELKYEIKSVQNMAPGLHTKFHIAVFNVANFGEYFRFQIGNKLKIASRLS